VTYHCINFNERVRKVPKIYILIFETFLTLSLAAFEGLIKIKMAAVSMVTKVTSLPSAVGPYTKNLAINV
jgi:hypothetical protein